MTLLWVDATNKHSAAEHRAVRRHVQKKRNVQTVQLAIPIPCPRPIAGLRAWPSIGARRGNLAFFEQRTIHEWSGWQDLPFWTLALSISHSCTPVAHALMAFAALHQGRRELAYTEHALSLVQPKTHLEALVSCMLIICFLNLTGQRSFKMLRSGSALLQECPDPRVKPAYELLRARPCMMPDLRAALEIAVSKRQPVLTPIEIRPFSTAREARDCLSAILQYGIDLLALGESAEPIRGLIVEWEAMLDLYDASNIVASTSLLRASALTGWVLLTGDYSGDEFDRILDLIEATHHSKMSFGIDGGLIDILSFVGSKCKGPARFRALQMLQGRTEGDRVAAMPAAILALQIELESNGQTVRLLEGRQRHGRIELTFEGESGRQEHEIKVPLVSTSELPAAIFAPGRAAYLDGETYFRLELEDFHFPMPRT